MAYIYSTLTAGQEYRGYKKGQGDLNNIAWTVTINGGTNISSKNLITPEGVLTTVSDKDLALLKTNKAFLRHAERGFIIIETKKVEVERVAKDMTKKDKSAPLSGSDFEKNTVTTNKE